MTTPEFPPRVRVSRPEWSRFAEGPPEADRPRVEPECLLGSIVDELTPGQVSDRSGMAVSALHFYEREGLISSRRTSGNQRRFRRDVLRRIALIRVAHRAGIPLAHVRAALDLLPDQRTPNRSDWAKISAAWKDDLEARIERLKELRDSFDDCIGCGCLSLDRCALANPGDQLGVEGTGPRRLPTEV